ncbi:MFS transporter [Lentzea sp. BCCO 10_0798]|uniref:MFS transporter n=1 Tax=Lentzea kristufekii TaxID=3095430 RepID=A0ABU4U7J5_9PSEU|nr:MFS transporter [Lentzea sp. BCCO 10_0798]MDX8056545.1 MFS transporter [Lentzea sp. BCCO 10_0798]
MNMGRTESDPPVDTATAPPPARHPAFPALLVLAQFGLLLAVLTPVVVALSVKLSVLAPENTEAVQGPILAVGSIMAIIAAPVFGNLSDRTTSRFGRRRPWLVGGAIAGTGALALVGAATEIWQVFVGTALAQLAINASTAAVGALYADQIPERLRGRIGALIGVATNFGAIGGALIGTLLADSIFWTFVVPGLVAVVLVTALAAVIDDPPADRSAIAPASLSDIGRAFTWPVRGHRDFSVNLLSRFLIWMGYTTLIGFQTLMFIQRFGVAPQEVAVYALMATGTAGAATLVGSVGGGWVSDRLDRRRYFVLGSGLVIGAGLVLLGLAGSVGAALLAGVVVGFGLGVYLASDLALAARLVPDPANTGRYMGIVQLASIAPQVLVPFAAPVLLSAGTGAPNYLLLFAAAGAVSIVGSSLMVFVRSVR